MDLKLVIPVVFVVIVFLVVAWFTGLFAPLFTLAMFYSWFGVVVVFVVLAGLGYALTVTRGTYRLLSMGGFAIVLFSFVVYPLFFASPSLTALLGFGIYGAYVLFLLLILMPPPDIDFALALMLERATGLRFWVSELIVVATALVLLSFAAVTLPVLWGHLLAGWFPDPFIFGVYFFVFNFLIIVVDRFLQNV